MEKVTKIRTRSGRLATQISLQLSVKKSTNSNVTKNEATDKGKPKSKMQTKHLGNNLSASNVSTSATNISDLNAVKNRKKKHLEENNIHTLKLNSKSHKRVGNTTNLDENFTLKSLVKSRRINENILKEMPDESSDKLGSKKNLKSKDNKNNVKGSFKMEEPKQTDKQSNGKPNSQSNTLICTKIFTRRSSRISFSKFKSVQGTSTPISIEPSDDLRKTGKTIQTPAKLRSTRAKAIKTEVETLPGRKATQMSLQNPFNSSIIKNRVPIYRKFPMVSPKKAVQFASKNKYLRTRRPNKKYIDYDNSETLESDDSNDGICGNDKAPAYKRVNIHAEKKKKDIYEFEADSCEKSDSDNGYDKEMIAVMDQIKKTEKKKKVAEIKKLISTKTSNAKDFKSTNARRKKAGARTIIHREIISSKTVEGETQNNNVLSMNPKKKILIKSVSSPCSQSSKKICVLQNVEINIRSALSPASKQENHDATVLSSCPPIVFSVPDIVNSFLDEDPIEIEESRKNLAVTPIRRPMTNSTALVQMNSPCRSNLVLRHGSYILRTKRDDLPSFNQEMVLNSTMVEAHEPLFRCRLSAIHSAPGDKADTTKDVKSVIEQTKATKQTTILNYMHRNEAGESVQNCTLFDENLLLSPVKISPPKSRDIINPDKKRALRDLTNFSSSFHNTPAREESDVEFFAVIENVDMQEGNVKPTRFNMKSPKKDEKQRKYINSVEEKEVNIGDASIFDSPPMDSEKIDNKDVVGIFQDFGNLETTRQALPSFTYERKRKRPRRISVDMSNSLDEYVEGDQRPKRSKKIGGMSKKEKMDFEAWVTSFNKECKAIDQITLEIE